jgi:hypothetical protein
MKRIGTSGGDSNANARAAPTELWYRERTIIYANIDRSLSQINLKNDRKNNGFYEILIGDACAFCYDTFWG